MAALQLTCRGRTEKGLTEAQSGPPLAPGLFGDNKHRCSMANLISLLFSHCPLRNVPGGFPIIFDFILG